MFSSVATASGIPDLTSSVAALAASSESNTIAAGVAHKEAGNALRLLGQRVQDLAAHLLGCGIRMIGVIYFDRDGQPHQSGRVASHDGYCASGSSGGPERDDPALIHDHHGPTPDASSPLPCPCQSQMSALLSESTTRFALSGSSIDTVSLPVNSSRRADAEAAAAAIRLRSGPTPIWAALWWRRRGIMRCRCVLRGWRPRPLKPRFERS
jgi:hypothetical protein